jgi:hypothetical protein
VTPRTPQEFKDARLAEAILGCESHQAAVYLVKAIRSSGEPPRRASRANAAAPLVHDVLASGPGRNASLKSHAELVDHLVEYYGLSRQRAASAIFESYDNGDIRVVRRDDGTYYGAA